LFLVKRYYCVTLTTHIYVYNKCLVWKTLNVLMVRIICIAFKLMLKKHNTNKRRKQSRSSWEYNMPSALIQCNFSPIPRYMTHISLSLNCSKLFVSCVYEFPLCTNHTFIAILLAFLSHSAKKQNFYSLQTDLYLSCPYSMYKCYTTAATNSLKLFSRIVATVENKTRFVIFKYIPV